MLMSSIRIGPVPTDLSRISETVNGGKLIGTVKLHTHTHTKIYS